ncbi:MAG: hypothetical protein COV07_04405 [Candidatus Vogelbacteria bacterium CG10_big_fil_rev_8_21_14_0_10_45_14]|uniref:Peptidoglycan binding-like domain-containing protein n=1 Tax=Candidatus Vogelbacteria bacterium CG10_big_fil_rev_8_21_14_0_10_45_14 TaxID=1975042 RepID=A0A2H0RIP7_9BACT|nr:MAG: hypothetical protein COV07_04405 [Candidatus Vogelbacteria bacterium CG10_big_fil_rev_8_21_14_0_10_45_14]
MKKRIKTKMKKVKVSPRRCVLYWCLLIVAIIVYVPVLREAAMEQFSIRPHGSVSQIRSIFGIASTSEKNVMGSTATRPACEGLTKDMKSGSTDLQTDGNVSKLQEYLKTNSAIYPEGLITGYVGPGTLRAIKRYQIREGLANVGDAHFGIVGGDTKSSISREICAYLYGDFMPVRAVGLGTQGTRLGSTSGLSGMRGGSTQSGLTSGLSGTSTRSSGLSRAREIERIAKPLDPPKIIEIEGPRRVKLGEVVSWTIKATSNDGTPLLYGLYYGAARDAVARGRTTNYSEDKNNTYSTVFEKEGAFELVFTARNDGGREYKNMFVTVGNAPFRGSTITFDLRDGGITCPVRLPLCDRVSEGEGALDRLFGATGRMFVGISKIRDGLLTWQSLPDGEYEASIKVPGSTLRTERFTVARGSLITKKVVLDRVGSRAPVLLRLNPPASFYNGFITTTGQNLGTSVRVYLDKKYLGNLEHRDGAFGFVVPREIASEDTCSNDILISQCRSSRAYTVRPGEHTILLQNEAGTSSVASILVFEDSNAKPFTPATAEELIRNAGTQIRRLLGQ